MLSDQPIIIVLIAIERNQTEPDLKINVIYAKIMAIGLRIVLKVMGLGYLEANASNVMKEAISPENVQTLEENIQNLIQDHQNQVTDQDHVIILDKTKKNINTEGFFIS